MFNNIRTRIATYYAARALEEVKKGEFESIMKGLDYMKKSLIMVPPSKEKDEIILRMRNIAKSHQ